ncbi:MAG: efflux RND transporter periplasmic adaptor subunit [Bacteroidales bacterium]|nr:efflux RND transporter periplasmic adaptor subunit [Bacteroidales bacterium]
MNKIIIMKKIVFFPVIALLFVACTPGSQQEQLKELKKERNALETQLNNIDQKIKDIESAIKGSGKELPSKNIKQVAVSELRTTGFKHYISAQGEVISDNNIFIPVESPGVVSAIFVDEGEEVAKGAKIAQIDASILKKQMEELKNGLDFAKDLFERRKRLWDKNIGSEIEYLQAKNNKENLEKKLATTREQLSKTTITAPISGTIDELFLKEGEMAPAGFRAARLVQMTKMKIKSDISENYLNQVQKGNKVIVKPVNGFKEHISQVTTVGKVINEKSRTFPVEIALPQAQNSWTPNMIMALEILNYTNDEAILAPLNIIQKTQNQQFIFVAEQQEGKWVAKKRWVETGRSYDNKVEILNGLAAGDKIITAGYQGLSDDVTIAIQ